MKDLKSRHGARVTAVLDAIDGKQETVSAHPAYIAAGAQGRDLAGFEANGLFLGDVIKDKGGLLSLFSLSDDSDAGIETLSLRVLGLEHSRRVVGRWGFRGKRS